ncbi:hypothetical protein SAMN05192573_101601 [Mucilaginibacter gossypii]|uniref:Uncharacterized protein n=1 Tax=Mucilaginibacter gossypii TaxID=551996 RepID=A0A1G7PN15_9SPHI|nr:hypothetical protein SAMN05192573_101601 [Mucilaginibacter gossypii]
MIIFSAKVNQFPILGVKVIFLISSINGVLIDKLKIGAKIVH